jgi:hypothetical protein
MSEYVRPLLPRQVFLDAAGVVIDYGNRWRGRLVRLPPEGTFSVVSNPQRFAPLHTVADALIEHLTQNYDITVTEDIAVAEDLIHRRDDVLRAVRLTPANANAAALTFIYTSFPSVIVHAGLLHDFLYPDCGCDACDETAESAAGEMEWQVLAVAAGNYSETVTTNHERWVGYELAHGEHHRAGHTLADDIPPGRLSEAESRLQRLPDGWRPCEGDGQSPRERRLALPDRLRDGETRTRRSPGTWQPWPGVSRAGD